MHTFIENFHFLRPWYLLLLIFPLLFFVLKKHKFEAISSWEKVCDKNLLDFLLIKGSSVGRRLIYYIGMIGFISGVIAASGPSWIKREVQGLVPEKPLMILLNVSSDMAQNDITPDRLSRAKYAITDLLSAADASQTGLIVYAGEPFLISPITEDNKLITNLLPAVEFNIMPENGDRLNLSLKLASASLQNGGWQSGNIVVFAADAGQNFARSLQTAEDLATKGFAVYTVNISAQANEKLQKIAAKGNGKYFEVSEINRLAALLNMQKSEQMKSSAASISQWLDSGYYLCFIPLICCLYFFRRGMLCFLLFFLLTTPVYAGFFLNADQEGLKSFAQGNFTDASRQFASPDWQGASYYRSGNYEQAYQKFSAQDDADGLYNQGNALAKMGKIPEAIKKYEATLQKEPSHEDAKFNLEYLKRQQLQQQSSSSPKSDEKRDQSEDKQNSQDNSANDTNQQEQNNSQEQASDDSSKQQNDIQRNQGQENDQKQAQDDSAKSTQEDTDEQNKTQAVSTQEQAGQPQDKRENKQLDNVGTLQNHEDEHTYNEEVQAREMMYREIPEDAGGLLRAFIAREYAKDRYAGEK